MRLAVWIGASAFTAGLAGLGVAQESAPPAQPNAAESDEIAPEKLSDEEKRKNSEEFLTSQRRSLARISQMVKEARGDNDMLQLNCLNSKLEQVKALLGISEAASTAMIDAMSKDDTDKVNSSYMRMALASNKTKGITGQAVQCVGAESVYTGTTEVQVIVEGEQPALDPAQLTAQETGAPLPPVASGS